MSVLTLWSRKKASTSLRILISAHGTQGKAFWRGRSGLNDTSVGIELVYEVDCHRLENTGTPTQTMTCLYPDYPPKLIENLIKVLDKIYQTYPDIQPVNLVAHQDIAPTRKSDPGPKFPWQYVYSKGYGAWYNSDDYLERIQQACIPTLSIVDIFYRAIEYYGYPQVTDENKTDVIKAFQTHFTPWLISGEVTLPRAWRRFSRYSINMSRSTTLKSAQRWMVLCCLSQIVIADFDLSIEPQS